MASASTNVVSGTSPYVKLTVVEESRTDTTFTLSYTLSYHATYAASTSVKKSYSIIIGGNTVKSGSYDINGKTGTHTIVSGTITEARLTSDKTITCSAEFSFNLTWSGTSMGTKTCSLTYSIPHRTAYSVKFDANGGTGAPSTRTKWHGITITLPGTTPTRTGYTFEGWGTSASDTTVDYAPSDNYTTNKSITLYAIWSPYTYAVKYNANGGTGAPANQTKQYDATLKLSSVKPTRTNYMFIGWGTSASAKTVAYTAGANYTANAALTLYAVWEPDYAKPRIMNLSVSRCNEDGSLNDEGTCAIVKFNWACDRDLTKIELKCRYGSDSLGSQYYIPDDDAHETTGYYTEILGHWAAIDPEKSCTIEIFVHDTQGYSYTSVTLPGRKFVIDFLAGGNGVAFGKAAEKSGFAEFGYNAVFNGSVQGSAFGLSVLPQIGENEDFNAYLTPGVWGIGAHATAGTVKNNPAGAQAGRLIVCAATGGNVGIEYWSYIQQWYIPMSFEASKQNAIYVRTITRSPNAAPNYYAWLKFTGTAV